MSAGAGAGGDWLALLDWRRRVADLYGQVRRLRGPNMVPAHTAWVDGRTLLLRDHPQSPVAPERRAAFHRVRSWPYDPAFAFAAPLLPVEEERLPAPLSSDGRTIDLVRNGRVTLPVGELDVFWVDDYGGGFFVPFRDATNGGTTYGGGRYLLDTAKGADLGSTPSGELVLDFNFAYQPSCAWDDRWACPLAPPGNLLEVAVEAGEQFRSRR
jgi:uncharacterized protein (DUF1684 family)